MKHLGLPLVFTVLSLLSFTLGLGAAAAADTTDALFGAAEKSDAQKLLLVHH